MNGMRQCGVTGSVAINDDGERADLALLRSRTGAYVWFEVETQADCHVSARSRADAIAAARAAWRDWDLHLTVDELED